MSTTYDRVEWKLLEAIILKLGFCRMWVEWTICLVSSVSYSFMINGGLRGDVRPTRGIRQADPLSPDLFLLCAKGLTCMLRDVEQRRSLNGVNIARECPSVSHILFSYDTILFCRATEEEGYELMRILQDYETASGQKVNVRKSSVSFEPQFTSAIRAQIVRTLKMREVRDQGKYLGLPSYIGRSKKTVFNYLVTKVEGLSQAGRELHHCLKECHGRAVVKRFQGVENHSLLENGKESIKLVADNNKCNSKAVTNQSNEPLADTGDNEETKWSKPPHGYLKVNCDTGWYKQSKSGVVGIICRDKEGSFLGA
ncbi:hypothetical protein LIER_16564 [Lithospermum erythrorhizon]|uniref:Reverse transcriptase domain-containing protein n=1 Tax=Lithospermum erythrorhizon TaxID=34254 RepID=A0AAV3Q750_LITER